MHYAHDSLVRYGTDRGLAEIKDFVQGVSDSLSRGFIAFEEAQAVYDGAINYLKVRRNMFRFPGSNLVKAFELAIDRNDDGITPSMLYAYAAIKCSVPFANGAPNLTADIPALIEFANKRGVPVCGKDFKSGQTFLKTAIAPALKARVLGVDGWFSTNILGNRDGEVLGTV